MNDLKTKSVLFYDNGNWVSMAQRLSKDFGKVMYYNPWKQAFPQMRASCIGEGINDIEKVYNFFDKVKEADIIVFPDILDGDLQEHLLEMGCNVWGSRRGELLELDRVGMIGLLDTLNLNTPDFEVVVGMDALRKYLKENDNIWVKTSCYRGDFETFNSKNYRYIETQLDEIESILGVLKYNTMFLCQKALDDCVEIGYDGYTIDGKYPNGTILGLEVKDMGYLGIFHNYNDMPKPIIDFNAKIAPTMGRFGYRGDYSNEIRIQKDGKWFMTDMTCRKPSPPGELMQYMFKNYSDIIWEGAHGNCIDPIVEHKYGIEVIIKSYWAEQHQLPVQFLEKYKDNVAVKQCTYVNGQYTFIPQTVELAEIGSVVAIGNTLDEAISSLEKISEEIRSHSVNIPIGSIDKAQEEIKKLEEFGYKIF